MVINQTRLVNLSVIAVSLCLAGGCSDPDLPTGETPSAAEDECPVEDAPAATAEHAATCVYSGWIDSDESVVSAYSVEDVTADLPVVMEDPGLAAEGCSPDDAVPGDVICTWRGTNSDGDIALRFIVSGSDSEGYAVTRIDVDR